MQLMPITDQPFHVHLSPTSYSQTTKIFINNKETFAALIVLLKPQTTKIIFINNKIIFINHKETYLCQHKSVVAI
jgi:hypothetical protein